MNDLNRRQLLATAAAAGAATVLTTSFGGFSANASTPPTGAQAPGFYQGRQLRMYLDQRRGALVSDAR